MGDTLRSIVEGMRCDYSYDSLRYGPAGWEHDPTKCPKGRLEALLAEYEKVDLVQRWQQFANEIDDGTNGVTACSASAQQARRFAAELETWLAVNLERIKKQMHWISVTERLPEHGEIVWVWDAGWNCSYPAMKVEEGYGWDAATDREPPENITHWMPFPSSPHAALEAQAKEKP